jgi:Ca2+-binding EF-hand superfamily protein
MKALIALFAAALFTTAVADDQTSKHDRGKSMQSSKSFDKLDKNQDGQLSKTEAQQDSGLSTAFASVDQDADGFVTKSEYTAALDSSASQPQRDREY